MPRFDLHSHSTASDGLLTPSGLIARAVARGVDVLALTDHDDTGGLAEARAAAENTALTLVPGAELSVSWESETIHVLALQIDPANRELEAGLASIRAGRDARAQRIAQSLADAGIANAYEGARKYVTSDRLVSRSHFARYLVEQGHAKDTQQVFKRFLVRGKPGYVEHAWATLPQAVGWIRAAGGQAVLAHPGRYRVTATGMRRLLGEFREAGGVGIEVLSSSHTVDQFGEYAGYARVFGLLASVGSDYHGPGESSVDLAGMPELPAGTTPVWSTW